MLGKKRTQHVRGVGPVRVRDHWLARGGRSGVAMIGVVVVDERIELTIRPLPLWFRFLYAWLAVGQGGG